MMKYPSLIIAGGLALCLAGISGTYWFVELDGQPDWQIAIALIASGVVSVMTFVCAYLAPTHGKGLLVSVLIFFAADTFQNAQGWQTFKAMPSANALDVATTRVDDAKKKLANLATPDANGAIRKAETYELARQALIDDITMFEADVEKLETPEHDIRLVGAAMALLQIGLAIFFLHMGAEQKQEEAQAEAAEEETPDFEPEPLPVEVVDSSKERSPDPKIASIMDKIAARANAI